MHFVQGAKKNNKSTLSNRLAGTPSALCKYACTAFSAHDRSDTPPPKKNRSQRHAQGTQQSSRQSSPKPPSQASPGGCQCGIRPPSQFLLSGVIAGCGDDDDGGEELLRTGTVGWAPSNFVSNCCDPFALPIILRWLLLAAGSTINSSSHYTAPTQNFSDPSSPKLDPIPHKKSAPISRRTPKIFSAQHQKKTKFFLGGNRRTHATRTRTPIRSFLQRLKRFFFMTIFVLKFFFFPPLLAFRFFRRTARTTGFSALRRRRVFSSLRPSIPTNSTEKFVSSATRTLFCSALQPNRFMSRYANKIRRRRRPKSTCSTHRRCCFD